MHIRSVCVLITDVGVLHSSGRCYRSIQIMSPVLAQPKPCSQLHVHTFGSHQLQRACKLRPGGDIVAYIRLRRTLFRRLVRDQQW